MSDEDYATKLARWITMPVRGQDDFQRWRQEPFAEMARHLGPDKVALVQLSQRTLWAGEFIWDFYTRTNALAGRLLVSQVHGDWWAKSGHLDPVTDTWTPDILRGYTQDDFSAFVEAETARTQLPGFHLTWERFDEGYADFDSLLTGVFCRGVNADVPMELRIETTLHWDGRDGIPREKPQMFWMITNSRGVDGWTRLEDRKQDHVSWAEAARLTGQELEDEGGEPDDTAPPAWDDW